MRLFGKRKKNRAAGRAPRNSAWEMPILPRQLFNDTRYLSQNPDAAKAVESGHTTAYDHYVRHGFSEEMAGMRQRSLPSQSQSLVGRPHADDALVERLIDAEIDKRTLMEAWDRQLQNVTDITFEMLSEEVDDALVPPLDRQVCDEAALNDDQRFWRKNGYLIKSAFLPHNLLDRYADIRARHPSPGGWRCPTPYMHIDELRDISLYRPLTQLLEDLIGEEMGLHLNLTGWVSTDRNWHQDDYLNPPYINSWYAAVWIALDDIHPDCGPFEFIPGSHVWPLMKRQKVRLYLTPEERESEGWPTLAERFVNSVAEKEIERRRIAPDRFIAHKGDVLIWHGRLMHRGSYANVPGMQRKSLISHYSGLSHRIDMPAHSRTKDGSLYFQLDRPLDFDPYIATQA